MTNIIHVGVEKKLLFENYIASQRNWTILSVEKKAFRMKGLVSNFLKTLRVVVNSFAELL